MGSDSLVSSFRELEARWQEVHASSLPVIHSCAMERQQSFDVGSLTGVSAELVARISEAESQQELEHGARLQSLQLVLDEHERLLNQMYTAVTNARKNLNSMSMEEAVARGLSGLLQSPADLCASMTSMLRTYELEFQLKQACVHTLRTEKGLRTQNAQSLVVAWECQPVLEKAFHNMRSGLDEQTRIQESHGIL